MPPLLILLFIIPSFVPLSSLGQIDIVLSFQLEEGKEKRKEFRDEAEDENMSARLYKEVFEWGEIWQLLIKPKVDITLGEISLEYSQEIAPESRIFCNGFQSWSNSREFKTDEKQKPARGILKGILKYYGDYDLYEYEKKRGELHSWTYGYIRNTDEEIDFIGSATESTGYTSINYSVKEGKVKVAKDCEGKRLYAGQKYMALQLFKMKGKEEDVFDSYAKLTRNTLSAAERTSDKKPYQSTATPATGWTSWYHYYHDITEEIILSNLQNYKKEKVAIQYFQIDDGYQKSVGEWTRANHKFPKGMQYIAEEVRKAGYLPGIWIAPFICEKKSVIYEKHKDWIVKDEKGKPIRAGINPGWSGAYYALDIYHPEVQAYLQSTFDTLLREWNYELIKTDFLFAAGIVARNGKSRGEIMSDAMLMLRQWVGDKLILGCGVPLGPSFHLVDYCRIGSDIHTSWEHKLLKLARASERVSTINSLQSTIGRRQLDGRMFRNDPDVFILRENNQKMSEAERNTNYWVNHLFGSLLFTSDDISYYSPEMKKQFLSGIPFPTRAVHSISEREEGLFEVRFFFQNKPMRAYINLTEKSKTVTLENIPAVEYPSSKTVEEGKEHAIAPRSTYIIEIVPAK